jgi:hypothetical protein
MRPFLPLLLSVVAVHLLVPGWSGESRLPLLGDTPRIKARPVQLDAGDPERRRADRLTFLDGVQLTSPDPAFGGFSAIHVAGERITLLSDGGNLVRFTLAGGQVRQPWFGRLATGPGRGWEKRDRDSEAMAVAPDGTRWVGFESRASIFRFAPGGGFAGAVSPAALADWSVNGGMESLVRLPDGRFVAIAERAPKGELRPGLIFAGDPIRHPVPRRFRYRPPPGYSPSDAAALPDGSLLVVNRRFHLPYTFSAALTLIPADAIRPGATVRGEPVATLAPPLLHDNFEGVAVTREGDATIVWLVSDDNSSWLQRTLLLRFRLDTRKARRP